MRKGNVQPAGPLGQFLAAALFGCIGAALFFHSVVPIAIFVLGATCTVYFMNGMDSIKK